MTNTAGLRPAYRRNLDALARAQKPSYRTAAYGRYVNRPLGRRVAAAVHLGGVTPNAASAVSALLSAAGIALLATREPSWPIGVAVASLLAAAYVMDSVDGQLARLRGRGSVSGEWLDHTIDCVKTSVLHLAVLVSWYRFPPAEGEGWLLVPLLFEVVAVVMYFGLIVVPFLRGPQLQAAATTPQAEHPLRPWLILPTDYGFLCWTFLLLGWPAGFLAAYTTLALLNTTLLVLALRKWWRELRALDSPPAPADEAALRTQ